MLPTALVDHFSIYSSQLSLLQLQLEQVELGTANAFGIGSIGLVKLLAAQVELVNYLCTSGLVVVVGLETILDRTCLWFTSICLTTGHEEKMYFSNANITSNYIDV